MNLVGIRRRLAAFLAVGIIAAGLAVAGSAVAKPSVLSGAPLAQQLAKAAAACKGPQPALASKLKNAQLREWLKGRSPIPIILSPWGKAGAPKPPKPPWKIAFTNSFAGNAARQNVILALNKEIAYYKKLGLVSSYESFLSNFDVPTHISQIRQAVHDGANAIMDIGPSPTATAAAIKDAWKAGVVYVTMDAPVTSPYAVNVTTNNYLQAVDWTSWMIQKLGGKGNVVMVEGVPGEPGSQIWEAAGECMFKKFSDIKVVANVAGYWTESKAKTAMLKVLATNPGSIDAVWIQGPGSVGVIQAFEQTGRSLPKFMTSFGDQATLAYWHQHPKLQIYVAPQPPQTSTVEAFRVIIRMLEGQRPILNTLYNVGPPITNANLNKYWKPSYKWPSSTGFGELKQQTWLPTAVMNGWFSNGTKEPRYVDTGS